MITVLIPDKGVTDYSLYAEGKKISKPVHDTSEGGTFINFEGIVILFYYFNPRNKNRGYRKAYVISENETGIKADLECVKFPIHIIFEAEGRKIDLLERIIKYIGRSKEVYCYSSNFWVQLTSLIDIGFNGKESSLTSVKYERLVMLEKKRLELSAKST